MSFIFSRALVEASLGASFSETPASAPSSENPTPRPCLWHARTTARFPLSRFGMTCAPLTESLGQALLTSWLEAFPARTSAPLEPEKALTVSVLDSGEKWRGSFAKYDPATSSWRTHQCSLLGGLDEFSETWPRWGSMRNGESYPLPTSALPTFASESGSWPTPQAQDAKATRRWREGRQVNLITAVFNPDKWRTWPTPCASASKGSTQASLIRKDGRQRENDRLDHAVMSSDGGQLNPEWVEWLMGWPIGHTGLSPLATARYHEWLQQHSIY